MNKLPAPPKVLALYIALLFVSLPLTPTIVNWLKGLGYLEEVVAAIFAASSAAGFYLVVLRWRIRKPLFYMLALAMSFVLALIIRTVESDQERVHFLEYGLMAVLVGNVLKSRWSGLNLLTLAFLGASMIGVLDELTQYFLPMRYCDVRDMAFNAEAALFGSILFGMLRRYRLH